MITIQTKILEEMSAKAIKGAGFNKLIPITSFVQIQCKKQELSLITTDGVNYFKVVNKPVEAEDFIITVNADLFNKLISKITTENIDLEIADENLKIKGNGNYVLPIPLDENGKMVEMPTEQFKTEGKAITIKTSHLKSALYLNKKALADTMESPSLTGYYYDIDKIISSDGLVVCQNEKETFKKPVLLSNTLVDLFESLKSLEIKVYTKKDGGLLFISEDIVIYGIPMEEITDYPIDVIKNVIDTSFDYTAKIKTHSLIASLERLMLFLADGEALRLAFTDTNLFLDTGASNAGLESIAYKDNEEFTDLKTIEIYINAEMLLEQLQVLPGDTVEISFGIKSALKLKADYVTQIIALVVKDAEDKAGDE